MPDTNILPPELEFLQPYVRNSRFRYREASWLKCSFDALVWSIRTCCNTVIDWRIPVGKEKILLTSPKYSSMLEVFRSWVILQTHVDTTEGVVLSKITEHRRIQSVLDCIDYLLLHADRLGLPEHGLLALSGNDLCAALAQILSNRRSSTSVYEWPTRVAEYLRKQIGALDDIDVANTLAKTPFLAADIPDPADRLTNLSDSEIVKARAWLWRQRRYIQTSGGKHGFRYVPDVAVFFADMYSGILGGRGGWPLIVELGLVPGYRVQFEFPKAPITTDIEEGVPANRARTYRQIFCSLSLLHAAGLAVPYIPRTELRALSHNIVTRQDGRFRTLPREVVFHALRRALEFALDHGQHLTDSFVHLAINAHRAGQTIAVFSQSTGVTSSLTSQTVALGIKTWSIETCEAGSGVMKEAPAVLSGPEYFGRLRQNYGLYELLLVLLGAIQVALGTLGARRQGELCDLKSGASLDASRTRLVFELRKSGSLGCRETVLRPIPPVAVELIELLERMQSKLVDAGLLKSTKHLFSPPPHRGSRILLTCRPERFNEAINFFCDYIEMPLNQAGQRYYLRTHQMRRFFALLFFWGSGFGGLDTLRYYLGHTNVEHLWRYISEAVPGTVLRGVQAEYAAQVACSNSGATIPFSDLLYAQFGTRNFQLVDSDVLTSHIEDLIEDGQVSVEPQFLDNGNRYRIAVLVTPRGAYE